LKLFYSRWDLLTEKLANIDESSITTHVDNDGITTTIQVLAKRDSGPYNSYCEYFVRKTINSHINDASNFNMSTSKSRSRAVPHPSSILASNRLILSEQWLPERQLQPNQIKYYYQCLQDKSFRRLHRKSNDEKKKTKKILPIQQPAKPFIVRIPQIQPKSALNTESGKVVIMKATGGDSSSKSFSVVKLPDGQIILVPSQENGISKIIKASSPPKPHSQPISISPQERRLRPIAPAPIISVQSTNELLNSLLAQQQLILQQQPQQSDIVLNEDTPLTTILETVTIESNDLILKPKIESVPIVIPKTKNVRKTIPISSVIDDNNKKPKNDPEEGIRYETFPFTFV
jgi:hypothetical protein